MQTCYQFYLLSLNMSSYMDVTVVSDKRIAFKGYEFCYGYLSAKNGEKVWYCSANCGLRFATIDCGSDLLFSRYVSNCTEHQFQIAPHNNEYSCTPSQKQIFKNTITELIKCDI